MITVQHHRPFFIFNFIYLTCYIVNNKDCLCSLSGFSTSNGMFECATLIYQRDFEPICPTQYQCEVCK